MSTDNSRYKFGLDFYFGNSVRSWQILDSWSNDPQFAYFRLGIGARADPIETLLDACHLHTGWHIGGYWPVALSSVPKTDQLAAAKKQIAKFSDILDMPFAVDYEQEYYLDKLGHRIWSWPSAGDLQYMIDNIPDAICYTSLSGMDEIERVMGTIPASWKFWIAWYLTDRTAEAPVDDLLEHVKSSHKIDPSRVLFVQTSDTGAYPQGASYDKGADYNRAVGYLFDSDPVPDPIPDTGSITRQVRAEGGLIVHSDAALKSEPVGGLLNGSSVFGFYNRRGSFSLTGSVSSDYLIDPQAAPPPVVEPTPAPQNEGGLYYLKRRDETHWPHWNGSFSQIGGRGQDNWIEVQENEIDMIRAAGDNDKIFKWAFTLSAGTIYIRYSEGSRSALWPVLLMSSTFDYRQQVRVIKFKDDKSMTTGRAALIDAIPFQEDGDYSAWTIDRHPEMWLKCPTDFKSGSYGASHNGITFLMPLLDPCPGIKFPRAHAGSEACGLTQIVLPKKYKYDIFVDMKDTRLFFSSSSRP